MSLFTLPVRYCELTPEEGTRWSEENFALKTLQWELAADETAFVMIDVWDIHPYESHLERGAQIARERIAPVVDACRQAGIAVVHAPSPGQAGKYPQWIRYASDRELGYAMSTELDAWPPVEFRGRKGTYAKYAKPKSRRLEKWYKQNLPKRRIMPCVEPRPEDFVVASGEQLHRLLRHRKILHLLYAGFAANMCVLHRDYGIIEMWRRGYNVILLRDCTTGIESAETLADMTHTKASVSSVEMVSGATATSADLLAALE